MTLEGARLVLNGAAHSTLHGARHKNTSGSGVWSRVAERGVGACAAGPSKPLESLWSLVHVWSTVRDFALETSR